MCKERALEALIVSVLRGVDFDDVDIDHLPELNEKEQAVLDRLGPDFIDKLLAKAEG
jgi:hypothetical protein